MSGRKVDGDLFLPLATRTPQLPRFSHSPKSQPGADTCVSQFNNIPVVGLIISNAEIGSISSRSDN